MAETATLYYARTAGEAAALALSNLALAPAAALAWILHRYARSFVYWAALVASILYHTCKTEEGPACLLPLDALRTADYFFAAMIVAVTGLYLIPFEPVSRDAKRKGVRWTHRTGRCAELLALTGYALATVAALALERPGSNDLACFGLGLTASAVILAASAWVWIRCRYGEWPAFLWPELVVAGVLLAVGVALFLVPSVHELPDGYYWWTHSLWHVAAGLGQYYLLQSRNGARAARRGEPLPDPWAVASQL